VEIVAEDPASLGPDCGAVARSRLRSRTARESSVPSRRNLVRDTAAGDGAILMILPAGTRVWQAVGRTVGSEVSPWISVQYRRRRAAGQVCPTEQAGAALKRGCGVVDAVERAKNRTKSKVRARVEYSIGGVKRVFRFAKVRYRGLAKKPHRLLVTCALANLFTARRHLLRGQPAWCARPTLESRTDRPRRPQNRNSVASRRRPQTFRSI